MTKSTQSAAQKRAARKDEVKQLKAQAEANVQKTAEVVEKEQPATEMVEQAPTSPPETVTRAYAAFVGILASTEDAVLMGDLASIYARDGYAVRMATGGSTDLIMAGAEQENGDIEVYVPWNTFDKVLLSHKNVVTCVKQDGQKGKPSNVSRTAYGIALKNSTSGLETQTDAIKRIRARDIHIVLGAKLTEPVDFVLMSYDPALGTDHSCAMITEWATTSGVPILNIADHAQRAELQELADAYRAEHSDEERELAAF